MFPLSFQFFTDPSKDKTTLYLKKAYKGFTELNRDEYENFVESPFRSYGHFQSVFQRQDIQLAIAVGPQTFTKLGDKGIFFGELADEQNYVCQVIYQKLGTPDLGLYCEQDTGSEQYSVSFAARKPPFSVYLAMEPNLWTIKEIKIGQSRVVGRDILKFFRTIKPRHAPP